MRCDRCKKETDITIMSRFNTEIICLDCEDEEKQDPRYEEARQAELEALPPGRLQFSGDRTMSDFTGIRHVDRLLDEAEVTTNKHGNPTRKTFLMYADRYLFDFNMDAAEWAQFDSESDASYFGIWLNKTKLRILEYVEGDLMFTQCGDAAAYDAEIAALCAFYEAAPSFVAIDDEAVTAYYQDRNEFFINPPEAPESDS